MLHEKKIKSKTLLRNEMANKRRRIDKRKGIYEQMEEGYRKSLACAAGKNAANFHLDDNTRNLLRDSCRCVCMEDAVVVVHHPRCRFGKYYSRLNRGVSKVYPTQENRRGDKKRT